MYNVVGVRLRPGETVEYVITDAEAPVLNDRVRAFTLWEGWRGYDRRKYQELFLDALQPFLSPLSSPLRYPTEAEWNAGGFRAACD